MTKSLSFSLGLIFLAVLLVSFVGLGHCQTPDAPSSTKTGWHYLHPYVVPEHARFWTVGRWDSPKPLRSNRETLRSWTFWAGETANWGSTLALVNVTRNEKQNPNIPTHRGLYVDAFVSTLAVSGAHYLSDRYICRGVGALAVAFASSYRGYESLKGFYP